MYPGPAIGTSTPGQAPGNVVPADILSRWTWGPFFLWLLWPFWNADTTHKIVAVAIVMSAFLPFVHFLTLPASLIFAIYLGFNGNRLMAANRQFSSLAEFQAVQSAWAKWGVILFVLSFLFIALIVAIFGVALFAIFFGAVAGSHAR